MLNAKNAKIHAIFCQKVVVAGREALASFGYDLKTGKLTDEIGVDCIVPPELATILATLAVASSPFHVPDTSDVKL